MKPAFAGGSTWQQKLPLSTWSPESPFAGIRRRAAPGDGSRDFLFPSASRPKIGAISKSARGGRQDQGAVSHFQFRSATATLRAMIEGGDSRSGRKPERQAPRSAE